MWNKARSQVVQRDVNPPLQRQTSEADHARFQALAKQLSQLDTTSSKIDETLRFLSDFTKDDQPILIGPNAPQHMQHLHQLRDKLKHAVMEIERLAGYDDPAALDKLRSHPLSPMQAVLHADVASPGHSALATPRASASQLTSEAGLQDAQPPGSVGGTVASTVAALTQQQAELSVAQLGKLKEEQRRLQALKKEIHDLELENEELRNEVASHDMRGLHAEAALLHASVREARAAKEELLKLHAEVAQLPQLQAEAKSLQPAVAEIAAMEQQLRALKDLDAQRVLLSKDIALMGPKVQLVDKMRTKVEQLEAEVSKGELLQERLAVLQAEADKLTALRTRMFSLQASAAEARQLERLLADYGKQEELLVRLQTEEEELQSRVVGIEALRHKVEDLRMHAREMDQLELRFASLASVATKLPELKEQVKRMEARAAEVSELEAEVEKLQKVERDFKARKKQVEEQRAHTEAQRTFEQEEAAENEARHSNKGARGLGYISPDTTLHEGTVEAIVRSITYGRASAGGVADVAKAVVEDAAAAPISLTLNVLPPPISLHLNISEERPLLPPGVSAELARQRAEVAALKAAEEEMRDLAGLRQRLQAQVDMQRASPAAAQVVRLQAELLEMQNREVEQLVASVDDLASVAQRLAALKEQHARLESEADEVFVLQSQLPELEAAAAQSGALRRKRAALEAEVVQVRELEAAASELEAALAKRPALEAQLQVLTKQKAELDRLAAELAEKPAVEARLAKLQQQEHAMHDKAWQADQLEADLAVLRNQLVEAVDADDADAAEPRTSPFALAQSSAEREAENGDSTASMDDAKLAEHLARVRAKHAALVAQNEELRRLADESEALMQDNELLKTQLNVAVAMYGTPMSSSFKGKVGPGTPSIAEGDETGAAEGQQEGFEAGEEASPQIHGSLASIFQHVRELEHERQELQANNEDLAEEIDRLRAALDVSLSRLDAFKGLAASVSTIRGKRGVVE